MKKYDEIYKAIKPGLEINTATNGIEINLVDLDLVDGYEYHDYPISVTLYLTKSELITLVNELNHLLNAM